MFLCFTTYFKTIKPDVDTWKCFFINQLPSLLIVLRYCQQFINAPLEPITIILNLYYIYMQWNFEDYEEVIITIFK